ncbi:NAD(P)/FAD-dependent oxidoreductase [Colwellia sp. 4_MG-2023]|uniref:NAD(P)/FAD-dependent oxidoreductase n=1 Tax=unclassified Colwellia TaxID=196834 RepID=UPI001C099873|nr:MULTISPECIES: NAD(P)/FAD-dependent oxidoreductase [unclassified Colwellia]MBU2925719.1 NAD(P)/FAD-dependent oxidoreductase [Colwellia sp. C2M11]MDO6505634.1 NAD(P)/FAD-dependent oxidoreductase [Colwellia sp. 5_MG-2023]MDO6554070.1 NAD(P)/FAD-dependent oxidoreductase [Colwellia sp. 4_MG-2023]MDO6651055.1 NAD(P)/FAD-dependent oxidoreductase [Colwellia sp. 3_MG-2023]MDO6664090.1 NAD(P)/FAD-dependent oxidoreductase [Colwellia sp. 2_MG-2023]
MYKIVIVGGGAGGLELATKLGNKLGRKGKAHITLVDKNHTHLWKPLLHEVAAGSLDDGIDALSYRVHAKSHGFNFKLAALKDIDRAAKIIQLDKIIDPDGTEILPESTLDYDILVMALGSVTNDFNTKGVSDNCIFLDNPQQAKRFHHLMLNKYLQLGVKETNKVSIAIVGAGATGVELSAELYNSLEQVSSYGFEHINNTDLKVSLVEAGEKILPALPERISSSAHQELLNLGVDVRTKTMVTEATKAGLITKDGELIEADLMVWAAGIKAPNFLKDIGGLETNRINQLVVKQTLQTTLDDNIYAIGDCASCPLPQGGFVPPRAQSAHQMASLVAKNIFATLKQKPLIEYKYTDYGSLVSLSNYSTVGSLMGSLTKGSMKVEGSLARLVYASLYRMHKVALHGYIKTALMMLVERINRILRPRLKLH